MGNLVPSPSRLGRIPIGASEAIPRPPQLGSPHFKMSVVEIGPITARDNNCHRPTAPYLTTLDSSPGPDQLCGGRTAPASHQPTMVKTFAEQWPTSPSTSQPELALRQPPDELPTYSQPSLWGVRQCSSLRQQCRIVHTYALPLKWTSMARSGALR
ncbi:hypothetical protein Bbelb_152800 [Branchiostoma belcheri]|nr:hypothetical protein Bbelb_152800 [Branchiostoma belcheri]